ncbi:MAG TPA: TIGR04222 domain-containing membrane protein, partial [Blastocatellia bacterium]
AESGRAPKMDLSDPYLIAYLRGGEKEALRVAVISLINRGKLIRDGAMLRRAPNTSEGSNPLSIEYHILKKFGSPGPAASIFYSPGLKNALKRYKEKLQQAGLISNPAIRRARLRRLLITILVLGVVGMIKVVKGISLGKPVGFLVVMMVAAMVIAAFCSFPRLTARGKTTLADIANLYSGLRTRMASFRPGDNTADLAMFAAVFGAAALAATAFGFAEDLFSRTGSDSSCGSSCGSHYHDASDSSRFSSDSGSSCGSSSDSGSSCGSSSDGGSSCGSSSDGGSSSGCGGCGSS